MLEDIGEGEFKKNNIFTTVPKGIYVTDTANCPNFPMDTVKIDKSHLSELKLLRKEYSDEYGARRELNYYVEELPWVTGGQD